MTFKLSQLHEWKAAFCWLQSAGPLLFATDSGAPFPRPAPAFTRRLPIGNQANKQEHTALRYLAVPLHLLTPRWSALSPPPPLPCFLYLLSDGLSSVRWMCAFPGQMALLLLAVPGSHFNTLASLPGERAPLLQGVANVCVVRRTAWVLTLFCVLSGTRLPAQSLCQKRQMVYFRSKHFFFFF